MQADVSAEAVCRLMCHPAEAVYRLMCHPAEAVCRLMCQLRLCAG